MKNSTIIYVSLFMFNCLLIAAQPSGPSQPVPIGESIWVLLAAGLGYGCFSKKQK